MIICMAAANDMSISVPNLAPAHVHKFPVFSSIVYAHASCNFQCITCPYSNANLHLLFKQILHYNWGSFFFSLGLMVTKPIQCSGASGHFREIREIF